MCVGLIPPPVFPPNLPMQKDREEETARKSNLECVRSEPEKPRDFESYSGLRSEREARGTETSHLEPLCQRIFPFNSCSLCVCVCVCVCARAHVRMLSRSGVQLFATPWTKASQSPLSMGIFQASILEWVTMPSSRESSQPRDRGQVSCIVSEFFTARTNRKAQEYGSV